MSSGPVRQSLLSVLISTRPPRDAVSRPFAIAALAHIVFLSALVAASHTQPQPKLHPPEFSEDVPPVLIQFADHLAARSTPAPPARMRNASPGPRAGLPLAPAPVLPNLAEIELRLASVVDSLAGAFERGTWAAPQPPTEAQLFSLASLATKRRIVAYSRAPALINRKDIHKYLSRKFPWRLRAMGGEARAMLWLLIDTTGHVHKAEVSQTSGAMDVDSIALASTHKMLFRPAENGGRLVPVWVQMPVGFRVVE